MIKLNVLLWIALLSSPLVVAQQPRVMRFDEVRPGMIGTGKTVFSGDLIETFDVVVIGTLPNIAPDRDLILVRCSGGPLAETGVLAGMSGSPITIDGQLVGAVAYSWGFSTEAIAGVTPIGEMLEIPGRDSSRRLAASGPTPNAAAWDRLYAPATIPAALDQLLAGMLNTSNASFPRSVPLSISSPGAGATAPSWQRWRQGGFSPIQAGSGGQGGTAGKALAPGAAVGLKLVRGDVVVAATGTVTWVDGDDVLAFGHPFLSLGPVDLPLTTASVRGILPSLNQSSRLAIPLEEVGSLRQDRTAGVYGRLRAKPRMIPVRMMLATPDRGERTYAFDIADDPLLSPLLLYSTLGGVLSGRERSTGQASLRLREGSTIRLTDGRDVQLDNLFSGPLALQHGTGMAAYILHLLMNNAWSRPEIEGINLIYEYDPQPREAHVRRVELDRYQVRAGEAVQVSVVVSPFRGPDRVLTRELRIPDETATGTLTLHVGGVQAILQSEEPGDPIYPVDLGQMLRLINQLRRNDHVYIVATREGASFALDGSAMPNLPPSVARVLSLAGSRGNVRVTSRQVISEEAIATDATISGGARVRLEVLGR